MDFIQLGWVSRVDEMILARVSSGFAGEKVWEDIKLYLGFCWGGKEDLWEQPESEPNKSPRGKNTGRASAAGNGDTRPYGRPRPLAFQEGLAQNEEQQQLGNQAGNAYRLKSKDEDKSKEKRLEDVPAVQEFPEVFPEDLPVKNRYHSQRIDDLFDQLQGLEFYKDDLRSGLSPVEGSRRTSFPRLHSGLDTVTMNSKSCPLV
ncbi:hypothetical protein Tco_0721692 [Tanacetum coccineum]